LKKWVIFLTAAVLVQSVVIADALDNNSKIHSELSRQIVMSQSNNSEDMIRVIVIMKEQYRAPEVKVQSHVDQKQHRMDTVNSLKQKSGQSQHNLISVLQGKGADKMKNARPLWIVNAITFEATPDVIEELVNRDDVAQVIPDFEVHLLEDSVVVADVEVLTTTTIAWGVEKINAPQVWDLIYNGININGTGVNVSIIDTGINYTHPDLADNYLFGIDYVNNDNDPMDDDGHGTHVAGTVAGTGVDGTKTGVAPGSKLFGVKVLNESGSGSYIDVIDGVQWSIDNGADIVSLSLGGPHDSSMTTMVNNAIAAGVLPVIAAGNDGPGVSTIECLGDEFYATTVGSTDSSDTIAPSSSRGPVTWIGDTYIKPDVTAPGVNIISTYYHGGYATASGTSMATPHVSGAAALILQAYPDMTPLEVRQLLEDTAVDLGDAGKDNTYGSGRIDVFKALFPQVSTITITPDPTNINSTINATINDARHNISYADFYIDADTANATLLTAIDGNFNETSENVTGIIDITNLSDGIHAVTIRTNNSLDIWNNQTNTSFTVDTTAPTSNTPSNTEFSANTTASFDKWILTDLHPGYYWVLRNETQIVPPTPWTNYTNITVPIDTNISLGDFNYTIQYNDTAGNNGMQNTVIITINDTIPPYASGESPANNSPVCDNTPLISVNITDNASGVNLDSIVMKINGSTVTPTISPLAGGYKVSNLRTTPFSHTQVINITVNATDNNSNILNHSWSFTVDGDAPIVTSPNATRATIESNGTDTTNLSVSATDSFSGINRVSINLSTIGGSPTAAMTNSSDTYYIITNATGARNGTYYLPINATDNAGNSNTSVNITLFVNDTTPPTHSDNMPLSGTNNTTPTISINATDRGSGINASSAEMKVEGVPVLLNDTSSGFTFNFTNTTTVVYNHGDTVNVTFNVSDNEGHMNSTSWKFYIDTVMPTIEITSHKEGYSTTSSSIIVTSTVNGTGSPPTVTVNSVTAVNKTKTINFNGTFSAPTSLTVGPNTIHANVTDAAGNTNSTLINVTRTTVYKTSNGGGGGGGGSSGEDFYNIAETETQRVSIFKGDNVSYSFENTQNPILNIKFTAKVSAGKVASKIEVLRNTSTMVDTPPPGNVYQNINIWVGNYGWATEKNIKDMTISFKVPLDWITSNNIDKSSIALYRYNDDSWEQLPTSLTTRNENSITFTSSTPGFSPFAISGETVSIPAVIPTAYHTPAAVATDGSNITSSSQTNEVEPGGKAGTIMLWVLFIIVIMAVTVIIYQRKDEILQGINNMRQQRGR
jgi:PGF-pre-PGF domain-containing protein